MACATDAVAAIGCVRMSRGATRVQCAPLWRALQRGRQAKPRPIADAIALFGAIPTATDLEYYFSRSVRKLGGDPPQACGAGDAALSPDDPWRLLGDLAAMAPSSVRALHYVLKVADRTATVNFLHHVLGLKALRHDEFREGCKAACNGPYDGMWSKTMMGFDSEDTSFVLELTYNYSVASYRLGNDFGYCKVRNRVAFSMLEEQGLGHEVAFNVREVNSPDGHTFRVLNEDPDEQVGSLASLCLHVTDIDRSLAFWADVLGLLEIDKGDDFVVLSSGIDQATLRLKQLPAGTALDRGSGYGRLAFSCPTGELPALQEEVQGRGHKVLTPLVSLDTPGKASVQVVILADPDGHEICFVGDEEFRELSRVDEDAPQKLTQAMARDTSREWGRKRKGTEEATGAASPGAAPPAAAKAAGSPAKGKPAAPPATRVAVVVPAAGGSLPMAAAPVAAGMAIAAPAAALAAAGAPPPATAAAPAAAGSPAAAAAAAAALPQAATATSPVASPKAEAKQASNLKDMCHI